MAVAAGLIANISSITPLEPFCNDFYGRWPRKPGLSCAVALAQMPESKEIEIYEVDPGPNPRGPYNFPARYIDVEGQILIVIFHQNTQQRWLYRS